MTEEMKTKSGGERGAVKSFGSLEGFVALFLSMVLALSLVPSSSFAQSHKATSGSDSCYAFEALTTSGSGVKQISLGQYHTAAVMNDGSLWMWGLGVNGELGNSASKSSAYPVKILEGVAQVALGSGFSMAVKSDGTLWTWGWNYEGRLGDGTTKDKDSPVKIMDDVSSIAAGSGHGAALKSDGSLWTWGLNYHGQLGCGNYLSSPHPIKVMDDVKSVALGCEHTAAIKTDGSLWTWGDNTNGILGNGGANSLGETVPAKIAEDVSQVSLGDGFSGMLKSDGSLWTWGSNGYGQLGDGTYEDRYAPVKVMDGVSSVDLGYHHIGAIKADGSLWMAGRDTSGELGDGDERPHSWSTFIETPIAKSAKSISLGDQFTGAVLSDGSLWMWGANDEGNLGDGTKASRSRPTRIIDGDELPGQPSKKSIGFSGATLDIDWDPAWLSNTAMSYRNELAVASLVLSERAETSESALRDAMSALGFTQSFEAPGAFSSETNLQRPAMAIASQANGDKVLVCAVIRGTKNGADVLSDIASVWDTFNMAGSACANDIRRYVESNCQAYDKDHIELLIAGHSYGGAAAGAAASLLKNHFHQDRTYVYTFGTPKNTSNMLDRELGNVFNTINTHDGVSYVPPYWRVPTGLIPLHLPVYRIGMDNDYNPDPSALSRKFRDTVVAISGQEPDELPWAAHNPVFYMGILMDRGSKTVGKDQGSARIVRFACPVDVAAVDSRGTVVAKIEGNAVTLDFSSKVVPLAVSEEKHFILLDSQDYTFQISGTASGTMSCDMTMQKGSDVSIVRAIEGVSIDSGKQLEAFSACADSTDEKGTLSLVVMDSAGSPCKTVEDDGSETDYVPSATPVAMHRLYNPNSGEHFYTARAAERDMLVGVGWKYEGVGWTAPDSGKPVYRLYNPYGGEHHYTLNSSEREMLVGLGWNYEGIGWYSDPAQKVSIYREYNPNAFSNNHNYTQNINEHNMLIGIGWRDEGVGWYGI